MTAGTISKAAAKKAETAAFNDKVRAALGEAQEAAKEAAEKYVASARISSDGFVVDSCGSATLIVFKPSYRLRKALQEIDEIRPGYQGAWSISHFYSGIPKAGGQSIGAHEAACKAACEVFEKHFPGEGQFHCKSWID